MLEWEPLADALQRVVDVGVAIEVAKKDICDHVSQDLIRARVLPAGGHYFITGPRAVQIPHLLKPADLDWARSRPKKPWLVNPSSERYGWERRKVSLLQLSPFDTDYRLCEHRRSIVPQLSSAIPAREITADAVASDAKLTLKKSRTGPKTGKKDGAIKAMKSDIAERRLTSEQLCVFPQKELACRYGLGRTAAAEARKVVLSEIVAVSNCDK